MSRTAALRGDPGGCVSGERSGALGCPGTPELTIGLLPIDANQSYPPIVTDQRATVRVPAVDSMVPECRAGHHRTFGLALQRPEIDDRTAPVLVPSTRGLDRSRIPSLTWGGSDGIMIWWPTPVGSWSSSRLRARALGPRSFFR
jgi:hypothetical protein